MFCRFSLVLLYLFFSIFWGTKAGEFYLLLYCFFIVRLIKRQKLNIDRTFLLEATIIVFISIFNFNLSKSINQNREALNAGVETSVISNYRYNINRPLHHITYDVVNRLNYFDIYLPFFMF